MFQFEQVSSHEFKATQNHKIDLNGFSWRNLVLSFLGQKWLKMRYAGIIINRWMENVTDLKLTGMISLGKIFFLKFLGQNDFFSARVFKQKMVPKLIFLSSIKN